MTAPTIDAPTQVRFSARAVVRTILQVGIPTLLALGLVVPQIVDAILEQLGEAAPDWLRAALLGAAAVVTAVAAVITRIMAIPQVEAFLRSNRFLKWLAAEPQPVPPVDVEPVTSAGDRKSPAAHDDGSRE
ncbi:hypothetical protein [Terrabacter terrigena]|uniref:Uncharacterized protein n=1 Tax=Terrabacter terrigena TaxID=574718 RepID=A0ABW3MZV0_9MICO